jgi:hypothetical protein
MVWSSVWAREEMTEEMYQDLLGPEGHNQIKQSKARVEELMKEVCT